MSFTRRLFIALAWVCILFLILVLATSIIDDAASRNAAEWAARTSRFEQELEWPRK